MMTYYQPFEATPHRRLTISAMSVLVLTVLAACQLDVNVESSPSIESTVRDIDTQDQHDQSPLQGPRNIMKAKLAHAQAVLEGIALEDFDQVRKNAQHLNELSQAADWQVQRTIEYKVFSTEFRRIVQDMAQHAQRKNIHALTLDYMQMTMTCVKCHSHMRWEGLAQTDAPAFLDTMAQLQDGR